MLNKAVTKESLIEILDELYKINTEKNNQIIQSKQEEAMKILSQLGIPYSEGYSLFKKYAHSDIEFNIIMNKVRPFLIY